MIGTREVKLAIKCVVTAALLWLAFRKVDLGAVSSVLSGLSLWWAAAALLLTSLIILSDAMLLAGVLRMFGRRVEEARNMYARFVLDPLPGKGYDFAATQPSVVRSAT